MTSPAQGRTDALTHRGASTTPAPQPVNLADLLERILDKGIVIAGDIRVNLLDIELLTVKIRLVVASVDKAAEMGIDWWKDDPSLSSSRRGNGASGRGLERENRQLRNRIAALEAEADQAASPAVAAPDRKDGGAGHG